MDIACPNCAATYRVPDTLVNGVNALRCAACEQTWVPAPAPQEEVRGEEEIEVVAAEVTPPPPAPEPPPPRSPPAPSEPKPEPAAAPPFRPLPPMRSDVSLSLTATRATPPDLAPRRLPEAPRRRQSVRPALILAWTVSIALVGIFVMALLVYRVEIAALWPPFGRLNG